MKDFTHAINFTTSAERDLWRLVDFIAEHDSQVSAKHVLEKVEALIATLSLQPERGAVVPELAQLGIATYRQVQWKPYRVIYQIGVSGVVIVLITDGRRDMQTLLQQRLFKAN